MYLLHRFLCPSSREVSLVVGSNGDFKLWLNGELVGEGKGRYIWNPFMYWFKVNIKKGKNTVVIKYVKKTEKAKLSFDIYKRRKILNYSSWQIDLATIL